MLDQYDRIEQYVRNIAYQLWNSAGRPDGLAEKFWEMACDISGELDCLCFA